ncbi:BRO family protein [Exiguobacterium antarcticum]|uniref:BRO family protein n=1 Tax=Exiguobacterium antarcticum TaxID=132920 RepID=A0ABT6QZU1_9BACL|nr:BRO family protein [Exiguobacterium antarcticum]MDI3234210.1 BRO family protein [Exiguobacterium antarcticum]
MNQLTKVFKGSEIRMIGNNTAPLFVASDVAKALGYKEPHKAVSRHCKGGTKHPVLTNGGTQDMIVIREPDVYRLVTNSKLPAAQAFENWVMEEVLPSIRNTGSYEVPKNIPFAELFTATAQLLEKQDETEAAITTLNEKIDQRMTLDYGQQLAIESAKKARAESLWDEISRTNSELYPSKAKIYGRFGSDIKRAFAVASYRDIKQSQFEEALAYVKSWRPSLV